jgi:hypothetical protein
MVFLMNIQDFMALLLNGGTSGLGLGIMYILHIFI